MLLADMVIKLLYSSEYILLFGIVTVYFSESIFAFSRCKKDDIMPCSFNGNLFDTT